MSEVLSRAALRNLLQVGGLPGLGPERRAGAWSLEALKREFAGSFLEAGLDQTSEELVRAAVLLWHDHLDASHIIAQRISNGDGSYLHGIMHRREPDYGNAKYWFHRVGPHPAYVRIAVESGALMGETGSAGLIRRLIPEGRWDPLEFVDLCEAPGGVALEQLARQIQGIELRVLLDLFLADS